MSITPKPWWMTPEEGIMTSRLVTTIVAYAIALLICVVAGLAFGYGNWGGGMFLLIAATAFFGLGYRSDSENSHGKI